MTEQLPCPVWLLREGETSRERNPRDLRQKIPSKFLRISFLLFEQPVNELWKLMRTSGNILLAKLCKLRDGNLVPEAVGLRLNYVNSLPFTARSRAHNLSYRAAIPHRRRRTRRSRLAFRPNVTHRRETFPRMRETRKVRRVTRLSGWEGRYFA